MTTAIHTDARYAAHTMSSHVERAERLQAIEEALDASGLRDDLVALSSRTASEAELTAIHRPQHIAMLKQLSGRGNYDIDPDTYVTADSWDAAVVASGSTISLVEAVVNGDCDNGFALVRPPGHHATIGQAMGFCLVNNIAAAARYSINALKLERVAIVDFDVHHGNGTQDIFYSDPAVLFCSTHAAPFYPGTGAVNEMGREEGAGATLNVPLPYGLGDQGYAYVFSEIIAPALRIWKPQLILVSAGYDAHWSDPLGPMTLSVSGFSHLTQMLYDLATELCAGRLVMVLEGGYNLEALGAAVVAALRVLLGRDPGPDPLGAITAREPSIESVVAALKRNHPLFRQQEV